MWPPRLGVWSWAPDPGPPSVNLELGRHCPQGAGRLETHGLPSCSLYLSEVFHSLVLPPHLAEAPPSSAWSPF